MMSEENKVYMGNLEYNMTDQELQYVLEEKGISVKEAKIIKDKLTGKSKGFGFAEVNTQEDIQKAIESLDGQEIKGRKLRVSRALKRRPKFNRDNNFRR